MNKDIAIKVENLSKVYKLYNAPIDLMTERLSRLGKIFAVNINLFYAISSGYGIIVVAQVTDASVYKQTSVAFFLSIES